MPNYQISGCPNSAYNGLATDTGTYDGTYRYYVLPSGKVIYFDSGNGAWISGSSTGNPDYYIYSYDSNGNDLPASGWQGYDDNTGDSFSPTVTEVEPTRIVLPSYSGERTYSSDGDTNGVFYLMGTKCNTEAWSNPYTSGALGITTSAQLGQSEHKRTIVDRAPSSWHSTQDLSGNHVTFDLGEDVTLVLKGYNARQRNNDNTTLIQSLEVFGSNDGSTFTSLHAATGITAGQNAWFYTDTGTAPVAYRHIRFRCNQSLAANGYLVVGEIELYGTLVIGSGGGGTPLNPRKKSQMFMSL